MLMTLLCSERLYLAGVTGATAQHGASPGYAKSGVCGYVFTLKKGEPWSGIVKNRRKNGDHYWVRANAVPMVREGKISGYMSIRTRATDEEIAAVEPLYKALTPDGPVSVFIKAWWCVKVGWENCLHYRFAGGRVA